MSCIFKNFILFLAFNVSVILAASDEKEDKIILRKPSILKNCEIVFPENQALGFALAAAKNDILAPDSRDYSYSREDSIDLFKYAFAKGKGFNTAIEAANEGINSRHHDSQIKAFYLFEELVKNGEGIEEAIAAANAKVTHVYLDIYALDLFILLVEKGHGIAESIAAAIEGLSDLDLEYGSGEVTERTYDLFQTLFDRGQGFEAAINYATAGIHNEDESVRNNSEVLLSELFDKGQGFEAAINAATTGINDEDEDIVASALGLFKKLVDKGQGFEEARKANYFVLDQSAKVRSEALKVLGALALKNRLFVVGR